VQYTEIPLQNQFQRSVFCRLPKKAGGANFGETCGGKIGKISTCNLQSVRMSARGKPPPFVENLVEKVEFNGAKARKHFPFPLFPPSFPHVENEKRARNAVYMQYNQLYAPGGMARGLSAHTPFRRPRCAGRIRRAKSLPGQIESDDFW
jgi:hypothetical protein